MEDDVYTVECDWCSRTICSSQAMHCKGEDEDGVYHYIFCSEDCKNELILHTENKEVEMQEQKPDRVMVFKETKEDWHPSYEIYDKLLVRVGFLELPPFGAACGPGIEHWRVCIWGADDCEMTMDFVIRHEAWECFLEVISTEFISRNQLIELGFRMA